MSPLDRGYVGGLDVQGQHNLARVRAIAAVPVIEAIANMRLARGDERNHVPSVERSEHQLGDSVDIWYDPPK